MQCNGSDSGSARVDSDHENRVLPAPQKLIGISLEGSVG
jgi:hypothetical protein